MLLERRLDNVVFRLGFATSRAEARQLVRHGHFQVNGRKADDPVVAGEGRRRASRVRREVAQDRADRRAPSRRSRAAACRAGSRLEKDKFEGTVKAMPARDDITIPIQEQLIVELYSR